MSGEDLGILPRGSLFSQCLTGILKVSPFSGKEGFGGIIIHPFRGIRAPLGILHLIADVVFCAIKAIVAGCEELVTRILLMGGCHCLIGPCFAAPGLIQGGLPEDDGGMVSVSADHLSRITDCPVIEGLAVCKILPSRLALYHDQAQFVAGFQERRILRIMGCAHGIETTLFEQQRIPVLHGVGGGIAYIQKCLMAVGSPQVQPFPINIEAVALVLDGTDTYAGADGVDGCIFLVYGCLQGVQVGMIRMPELWLCHSQIQFRLAAFSCRHRSRGAPGLSGRLAVCILQNLFN